MTDEEYLQRPICPLWLGGRCPICDDEWCDLGISKDEADRINEECCKSHRDLMREEYERSKV